MRGLFWQAIENDKIKKAVSIILFFLLSGFCHQSLHAQKLHIDTISWSSGKAIDQTKNETIIYDCQFKTFGGTSIDWSQKGVSRVYHFNITGIDGSWSDASTDGQIVFHVTLGNFFGDLTFSKSGRQTTVAMDTNNKAGDSKMKYVFYITSVTGNKH